MAAGRRNRTCGSKKIALCCLLRPYRRQAGSHRYTTTLKACIVPVGAGLPAIGPVKHRTRYQTS
ncbi:hypothetical protein DBB42_05015 [Pseudomonas plecoglossicida]|uniref:Uncharacterized protein n=1 Tax=Pseudomonas plecoglossicida TaxID=70775 RepID=A0A2R7UPH4_PSEDL|nr:hypothetical protein DBB42_05015 [Pseudomonas plecoglossicida]